MEKVSLNNVQLDHLAKHHCSLGKYFYKTVACDRLPKKPVKRTPVAYIVNTDPHDKPGKHWLALWTEGNKCEVFDSYGLPLEVYQTTKPLENWLKEQWKYVIHNTSPLQSVYSQSCGDYALFFLIAKAEGQSLQDFLKQFKKHDYVYNDHKVGQMLKKMIHKELAWDKICKLDHQQDCNSYCGVRHLLK